MLGAEEQLNKAESLLDKPVDYVKQLFHTHEEFMMDLTQYQVKIGETLTEGQDLVKSGNCTEEEREEISRQMSLLNTRWDQLRVKAMDRQSNLHEALMTLQKKQLDGLRTWLTSAEDKISKFTDLGPDLNAIQQQIQEHQQLQDEVSDQQEVVNSLSNMVVIVDEGNTDNENAFVVLEDQLVALGERWAHVCHFVEDRGIKLHSVLMTWKLLNEEEVKFTQWLTKLDRRLTEMEEAATETKPGSKFVLELVKRLQKMEKEMEAQQTHSASLADLAQKLLGQLNRSSPAAIEITRRLESLTQQWDSMLQRMEDLGENLSVLSNTLSVDGPGKSSATAGKHELPGQQGTSETNAKKRRLDSWRIQEWQRAVDSVSSWFAKLEDSIGVEAFEEEEESLYWDSLGIEEQQVVLENIEADIEIRKTEVEQVIQQGKQIIDDMRLSKF